MPGSCILACDAGCRQHAVGAPSAELSENLSTGKCCRHSILIPRALLETRKKRTRSDPEDCGIALDHSQLDQLWSYHQFLRAANVRLNLTRIHNFENMVLKHYVDSLLVLRFLELPSPLIDMGSGPGLPGIPLKIARPETRMILAEPRGARAEFLAEVCTRLGLEDIEVYAHKLGPNYPGQGRRGSSAAPWERSPRPSTAWPRAWLPAAG